jgi:hypothetical protein
LSQVCKQALSKQKKVPRQWWVIKFAHIHLDTLKQLLCYSILFFLLGSLWTWLKLRRASSFSQELHGSAGRASRRELAPLVDLMWMCCYGWAMWPWMVASAVGQYLATRVCVRPGHEL